ncbi:MAG: hypothetical protein ACOX3E_02450 [Desulfomonilia bacterium]|jgi:hypothetical protein|uniref:Uncharacterized protein n=1 Tax=anaerobic digester metagenome TaxID=1263854 RepID=A0A485LZH7_9ZZZZ|nr:hypothetical protein [Pseudomonadota bacterium]HON37384.1 hypothetical protein [Deltaproteobacteria bacterium]HRS55517.1 hypothetical protein [Desulfomonilia bacterium]HPD20561.1 hypothetical protein [Deltaproteobacteria bacterium]HPX17291.1 hypothetical protein [Deltaproteobacteria bacterium]
MKKLYVVMTVLALGFLVLPGCARIQETFSGSPASQEARPVPRYLDFSDILLPGELNKVVQESYITNGHGRLVLSGRLQGESLAQYFMTSMYSDGWTTLNQYKYQGAIKLFFKKSERIASILITENPLGTRVEIWAVPLGKI